MLYGPQRRGRVAGRVARRDAAFSFFATPNPGTSNPAPPAGVSVDMPPDRDDPRLEVLGDRSDGGAAGGSGVNWNAEAYPTPAGRRAAGCCTSSRRHCRGQEHAAAAADGDDARGTRTTSARRSRSTPTRRA